MKTRWIILLAFATVAWTEGNPLRTFTSTTVSVGTTRVATPATAQTGREEIAVCRSPQNTAPVYLQFNANIIAGSSGAILLSSETPCWTFEAHDSVTLFAISTAAGQTITATEAAP